MITSSKEADSTTKQEGNTYDANKIGKDTTSSSSSAWLRLKDPRIVRVSRAFGGKDRHSKVCTIRGLRDRRVRLSVPTAIQLYDLQDRLGLNQPSKVVDWLLNAAKHEIDELPPLPVPGNLGLNHQMMLTSEEAGASQSNKEGMFKSTGNTINWEDPSGGLSRSSLWSSDAFWRAESKEVPSETTNEKENWRRRSIEEEKKESRSATHSASIPALFNNAVVPYGSFYQLEPSSYHLSHLGSHGFATHAEDHHLHGFNGVPLPASTLSLVCPPPTGPTQSFFPNSSSASLGIDPRQINHHFQMLSSSSESPLSNPLNSPALYSISQFNIRPFSLSMSTPRPPHSHNNSTGNQPDKEQEFRSKIT